MAPAFPEARHKRSPLDRAPAAIRAANYGLQLQRAKATQGNHAKAVFFFSFFLECAEAIAITRATTWMRNARVSMKNPSPREDEYLNLCMRCPKDGIHGPHFTLSTGNLVPGRAQRRARRKISVTLFKMFQQP